MTENKTFDLSGHVALVTGSSTGIGLGVAKSLGEAGAKVALNYANNGKRAEKALAEFKAAGHEGDMFQGDVTDSKSIKKLLAAIEKKLGTVDILVCNATPPQPMKTIEDYEWAFFQQMLDFFVKSPVLLTKACLPNMKKNKWGRIINITSEVFQTGLNPYSAYVAAKGGQVGLCRSLAPELAPFGVTVNMVAPGWVPVERHANDPQEAKDAYVAEVPMGRFGVPNDVGSAVTYFASEEASFITGQTISVTGGHTVH